MSDLDTELEKARSDYAAAESRVKDAWRHVLIRDPATDRFSRLLFDKFYRMGTPSVVDGRAWHRKAVELLVLAKVAGVVL